MKKTFREATFTHFFSLTFVRPEKTIQHLIANIETAAGPAASNLRSQPPERSHITLGMLSLGSQKRISLLKQLWDDSKQQLAELAKGLKTLKFKGVGYFQGNKPRSKYDKITVLYLKPAFSAEERSILNRITNLLTRKALKSELFDESQLRQMYIEYDHKSGLFVAPDLHLTLFRTNNSQQSEWTFLENLQQVEVQLGVQSLDVSTRGAYGEDGFYLPLQRLSLII